MIQLHCRNNRIIKLYKVIEEAVIFIQIVFIDIIMAADNAIIIGLVAAGFAPANRKKIIMWGVFAAFIFSDLCCISHLSIPIYFNKIDRRCAPSLDCQRLVARFIQ